LHTLSNIADGAVKCRKSPVHLNYDQSDIVLGRLISPEALQRTGDGVHDLSGGGPMVVIE